jgi:hypothetical protein
MLTNRHNKPPTSSDKPSLKKQFGIATTKVKNKINRQHKQARIEIFNMANEARTMLDCKFS